jgi:hypothetical protein
LAPLSAEPPGERAAFGSDGRRSIILAMTTAPKRCLPRSGTASARP